MIAVGWWEFVDEPSVALPQFEVDDVQFVQPVGFVWHTKPKYRIKARSRKVEA